MSPGVANRVYAISGDGGVFITVDAGKTWSLCADIQKAEKILISQKNPKYVMFISEGKLSISNDDGKTFKTLSVNDSPVYAMCFSDKDENVIYAGTARGAYKSTDLGVTWNGMAVLP